VSLLGNEVPLSDEDRGTAWGKITAIQQLLSKHGYGLNDNTALALRVITYLCEVPMGRRDDLDLDVDVLINIAHGEQQHIRKEH